jgi:prophage regulatory protein
MPAPLTLQRLPAVLAANGKQRAKHYLDVQRGLWTKPVTIGRGFAAWPAHETEALVAARIGGADDETMRELVRQLHARRQAEFAAVASRYLTSPAATVAQA